MTTIRIEKGENFSIISNQPINDERLTWQARGVIVYLLSKPNDWRVRVADLISRGPAGRDAIYSIINELIEAGYMERVQGQVSGGQFGPLSYVVREHPARESTASGLAVNGATVSGRAASGSSVCGSSVSGEAGRLLNTEDNQRLKGEKTERARTRAYADWPSPSNGNSRRQSAIATFPAVAEREGRDPSVGSPRGTLTISPAFREWYEAYPAHRRISIAEAWRLFSEAASRPDHDPGVDQRSVLRAYRESESWTKNAGQYIPSMRRYITERMWERDPDPMARWRRDGHVYPIYVRGRGLTWPPGYKPPEGATQMARVLNEAGEWIANPTLC